MPQSMIKTSTMNARCENDDLDTLLRCIKRVRDSESTLFPEKRTLLIVIVSSQLEISLAEKDDLLALKEQRITALEEAVSQSKITSLVETTLANEHPKTRSIMLAPSTPNHVSDDSGEVNPPSNDSVFDQSLSLINHAHSSDEDSAADVAAADGRWNIPFDEASFDDLVVKSSSVENKRGVLAEIGFIPIGKPSLWHFSHGTGSPLRPLPLRRKSGSPRRRLSKEFTNEKENVTPVKESIGVGSLFNVR